MLVNTLRQILHFISLLIPFLIGLGVLYFMWAVFRYAFGNEDKSELKGVIFNGVIILFVMVSVWGLVWVLFETFGGAPNPILPPVPTSIRGLIIN